MAFADPFTPSFFRRLQQLKIRTTRTFLGSRQGGHLSKRKGQGLEFAEFRPYAPGDDFRHIDWGILGRTDRVYVREFREEQDLNVMVILDASSSMQYPEGEEKFSFARNIALSLGYVALTDGDSVQFSLLGQKNTPRFRGPRAMPNAAKELQQCEPSGTFNLATEVRAALALHKTPGKCFIVSDFLYDNVDLFEALDLIRYRNFEIALVQVLAPSELSLNLSPDSLLVDSESGETLEMSPGSGSAQEYAELLADQVGELERYAAQYGITHLLLPSNADLATVVLTKFPEAGLLR